MAPPREDDWSDSEDEDLAEVETSVLLGVPDGPVDIDTDLNDVAVSRIGGHPAFLMAPEPPYSSSQCKTCHNPMELLVQMWCPFEDSPMDRGLYIWGCPRAGCQGKEGTIRAWRGLRYNEQYAAKLEKKLARQKARERALATKVETPVTKINPFASNPATTPNPFGLGAQIFGNHTNAVTTTFTTERGTNLGKSDEEETTSDDSDSDDEGSDPEKSLLTAMASAMVSESPWKTSPSYPALYLSTTSEFLTGQPKPKLPSTAEVVDPKGNDTTWMSEAYEDSMDTDPAFDRFTKRAEAEPEQCVRYDLKGTPLPFSSDEVFKQIFPAPASPAITVTKSAFTVAPPMKRTYNPASIAPCTVCGSKRVFECQLMPNLINILRPKEATQRKLTDEERRKEVEEELKKGNKDERRAMEWGTCMIFSCEKDCCIDDETKKDAKYAWREEAVLIQWDT